MQLLSLQSHNPKPFFPVLKTEKKVSRRKSVDSRMMYCLLVLLLCSLALAEKKDSSNGFGNDIKWIEFKHAVGVAKDLNKPILFLIHKTWCGACKGLQREFKTSPKKEELVKLSEKFVMVNVEDDDEPEDAKYAPDGGYIPRILFLDTDGEPLKTNNEQKYKNNKYFYPLLSQIIDGMERALLEFEGIQSAPEEKKDEKSAPSESTEEEKVADESGEAQETVEEGENREEETEKKTEEKDEL